MLSCTNVCIGRMWCVADMSAQYSARANWVCGKCKFISSPSKSALYDVTTSFEIRNAEPLMILARWAIKDPRPRVGARLRATKSLSIMWRMTMSPTFKTIVLRNSNGAAPRLIVRLPVFTCVAPGWRAPFSTMPFNQAMLKLVTTSGKVIEVAMSSGTPTWSMSMNASPAMTARAFLSQRFDPMWPRTMECTLSGPTASVKMDVYPSPPWRNELLLGTGGSCPG